MKKIILTLSFIFIVLSLGAEKINAYVMSYAPHTASTCNYPGTVPYTHHGVFTQTSNPDTDEVTTGSLSITSPYDGYEVYFTLRHNFWDTSKVTVQSDGFSYLGQGWSGSNKGIHVVPGYECNVGSHGISLYKLILSEGVTNFTISTTRGAHVQVQELKDITPPTYVSSTVEGYRYKSGEEYWFKTGDMIKTKVRGTDVIGIDRIYTRMFASGLVDSRAYFSWKTNSGSLLSGYWNTDVFRHVSALQTYSSGNIKEMQSQAEVKVANDAFKTNLSYYMIDNKGQNTGYVDTGKKINIDARLPDDASTASSVSTLTTTSVSLTWGNFSDGTVTSGCESAYVYGQTYTANGWEYGMDLDGNGTTETYLKIPCSQISYTVNGLDPTKRYRFIAGRYGDNAGNLGNYTWREMNRPPNTPTLTVPSVQFEHGDQHVISWNASDPNGNPLTYTLEVSYNNGSTWTQVYNGANKNYTFTVPSNQTQVNFRVRAYDGTAYSAYRTGTNKTIREVMYYWSKYNTDSTTSYNLVLDSGFGLQIRNSTSWYGYVNVYAGYTYDKENDILKLTGFVNQITAKSLYDNPTLYTGYYAIQSEYIKDDIPLVGYPGPYLIEDGFGTIETGSVFRNAKNFKKLVLIDYKKGSSLIEANIIAKEGTYPDDGRHTDGHWYIKGQRVLASDTTPPVIELTEQSSYGATSTVTVKTYDTSAVSVTKWASGEQAISYFATNGTSVSSGKFVATSNGTYTVYAKDSNGNQSVETIDVTKIDTISPSFVSAKVEGANYIDGSNYWFKPGKEINLFVRGRDDETHPLLIYSKVTTDAGDDARAYYRWSSNLAVSFITWTNFTFNSAVSSYDNGSNIKELKVSMTPNNTITTDILGEFSYFIVDNANNSINGTSDTYIQTGYNINVDGKSPIGNITPSSNAFTKESLVLTATSSDSGSGVKRIQVPNGSYVNGSNATYTVSSNGTYTFTFEDNVGNVSTKSITISNIDKTAPNMSFTPDMREADLTDIEVQTAIIDSGGAGYKQSRFAWSKDEVYPTEGWSEWSASVNPLITQTQGGKWYLHIEAMDNAGNIGYAYSGIYDKIVLSGGPSVNIYVFPLPTGQWVNQPIDVYVMDSGDSELLAKAKKYYHVSNSPLYPTNFDTVVPTDKKVQLNLQGENFIHIQYILDDGTKISSTAGPYLIDSGVVGDFEMKLVDSIGNEVVDWSSEPLKLVMSNPSSSSVSGIKKEYRIEGVHTDWQTYTNDTVIGVEGDYRVFGRIVSGTGTSSQQKAAYAKIDKTKPTTSLLKLVKNINNTYDVRLKTEDALSGVKEVKLNNGTSIPLVQNMYAIDGLTVKPTSVSVVDVAGNSLSSVAFATEPTITFDAPYTLTTPLYRNNVVANLSNATGYLIGNRGYACTGEPCKVTLSQSATLTAVKTEGTKETRVAVKMDNIDQSHLNLVLSGKRNPLSPKDITFTWNYALTTGTLSCYEDGQSKLYAVTGKSFVLNGKNYLYSCFVSGDYKGVALSSNTITIQPNGSIPSEGTGGVPGSDVTTNIYFQETMLGKSYLINAKTDNYTDIYVPIPENEITSN